MKSIRTVLMTLAVCALAFTPAAADIMLWSQTPSSNSNSDLADDINLVEGMAPSEVNDSVRALMAEVRKWVDDMGASKPSAALMTTGGTANAQTITTNGTASALTHGHTVCFIVGSGLTNTGATTLNVDGLGAKAVQARDGTALSGGELPAGSLQCATYQSTDQVWLVHHFKPIDGTSITVTSTGAAQRAALTGDITATAGSNATALGTGVVDSDDIEANTIVADDIATSGVATAEILDGTIATADIANLAVTGAKGGMPVGMVFDFASSTCPTGSVAAYGQELNDTTYSALLAVIGTTYGAGGASTFLAPDIRGRVTVGEDDMGGVSANRVTDAEADSFNGDTLGDTGGVETQTLSSTELPSHTHAVSGTSGAGSSHSHSSGTYVLASNAIDGESGLIDSVSDSTDSVSRGSSSQFTYVDNVSFSFGDGDELTVNNTDIVGTSGSEAAHTHSFSDTSTSAGSSEAVSVMQPSIVLTKCIWTGV